MIIVNKGRVTERTYREEDYEFADAYTDWLAHRFPEESITIVSSKYGWTSEQNCCLWGCIYCSRNPESLNQEVPLIWEGE